MKAGSPDLHEHNLSNVPPLKTIANRPDHYVPLLLRRVVRDRQIAIGVRRNDRKTLIVKYLAGDVVAVVVAAPALSDDCVGLRIVSMSEIWLQLLLQHSPGRSWVWYRDPRHRNS